LQCTPAFHIKYDATSESNIPVPYVIIAGDSVNISRFTLLPQQDWFSKTECDEWIDKMICYIAANKDVRLQFEFYENTDWVQVFKQYILVYCDELATHSSGI
jgi:hypothetical protein